ncbi:MAG TPA: aromatic ring-hydroxylating dioxygenase subunit alpha [Acidimicrobiales bacterium]|nr:aromatic ring-hydroxylating dioxygenase subunit alpha [Acidimicrobiales bacterium]
MTRLRSFWHPVAWATDIGASLSTTTLLGERLVLWRADGEIVVAADRCPHRGTRLSLGSLDRDGALTCAYHGWRFGSDGPCLEIPQLAPGAPIPKRIALETFAVVERAGIVWVALDEPEAPVPAFPEWEDPAYRHVACAPYTWSTSAGRMVENFTDFGHLGYLHDGLLGTSDDLVVPEHRVERDGIELHYELTMEVPNTNDRFAVTAVEGERGLQTNGYILTLPFTIALRCRYGDTGAFRTLFFAVQPHSDVECTGYCYQSRNFDLDAPGEPFVAFQALLAEQDRPIVESQWPVELPLAMTDEIHLPFDRVAIAYRRAMADLLSSATGAFAASPTPALADA